MDLVDEYQGSPAQPFIALRIRHHGLDFLDAAQHGAEWNEVAVSEAGDDASQRGFSHTRRAPENDGAQLIAVNLRTERLARRENVGLPDKVLECGGAHPFSQRTSGVILLTRQRVRLK